MVGYNKEALIFIGETMDSKYNGPLYNIATIMMSLYSVLAADDDLIVSKRKKIFTVFVFLTILSYKNKAKFEAFSFSKIVSDVFLHDLNRELYRQAEIRRMIHRPNETPIWKLLAFKEVSKESFVSVLAIMMVHFECDFEHMTVERECAECILQKNIFIGNSMSIDMDKVINECD